MKISKVKIKGFRNFKDITVNLGDKNLIFGANNIGKSNFIYALRLLLDKNLSENDIEPEDTDFYAFEDTNKFEITIYFNEILEPASSDDCIRAKFKDKIKCECVFQEITDIPKGFEFNNRTKPWGTGHAILSAKKVINGPFLVINADDYYGKEAYKKISELYYKDYDDKEGNSQGYCK